MFRTRILCEVSKVGRMAKIPIHPNPRVHLLDLYSKTLTRLSELPKDSFYRSATTAIVLERKSIIEAFENVQDIVDKTNCIQIEQLIEEANDELLLIDSLKEENPWDKLAEPAPKGQWE